MAILGQQNPQTYRTDNVFTATAGQTVFYAHYNPTTLDVFRNGAKLIPVIDYVANDGVSVVLTAPALDADVIQIIAYKVNLQYAEFSNSPIDVSSNASLSNNLQYIASATNITLTLPPNPLPNWAIRIMNASNGTNITVARNGAKIHTFADDLIIDLANTSVTLIYINSSIGWWVI